MKIVINYDLASRIFDVNNKNKNVVLIRRRTNVFVKGVLPILLILDIIILRKNIKEVIPMISYAFLFNILMDIITKYSVIALDKIRGVKEEESYMPSDTRAYIKNAETSLKKIVQQLQAFHIKTTYSMLLRTEVYHTEFDTINEGKIPDIVEKKYFNVPTISWNNDEECVSIVQEHVVGSKEYVLSLGSPKAKTSLALQGA